MVELGTRHPDQMVTEVRRGVARNDYEGETRDLQSLDTCECRLHFGARLEDLLEHYSLSSSNFPRIQVIQPLRKP